MEFEKLDIKGWMQLAKHDPEAFEKKRAQIIQQTIASASGTSQKRLEGLQWQIDQVREQADTPIDACRKVTNLMWKQIRSENGLINVLEQLNGQQAIKPKKSAEVIPLPLKSVPSNKKSV